LRLEDVRIGLLAYLTFKLLPIVACHVICIILHLLLAQNPTLQAFEVNQADGAATLASKDQWIIEAIFLFAPTKTAFFLILKTKSLNCARLLKVCCSFNRHCLFHLFQSKLLGAKIIKRLATEILHLEPDSSKLYYVKSLYLVVL
jgi:hypothetical protein